MIKCCKIVLLCYNQNSDLFRVSKSKQALSDAGAKTGQALRSFGTATANKWTEIK